VVARSLGAIRLQGHHSSLTKLSEDNAPSSIPVERTRQHAAVLQLRLGVITIC
jgi:hypothetical protein